MISIIDAVALNLPEKGDCVDWLVINKTATIEELRMLPKNTCQILAPVRAAKMVTAAPDHLDLAREALETIGAPNILSTETQVWYWRGSGVWQILPQRELKKLVQDSLNLCNRKITKTLVDAVTDVLKTLVFSAAHTWNRDRATINFLNGELHGCEGEWDLKPHNRESHRTTQIPHEYDASADCPRFRQFLLEVFRDDEDKKEKIFLVFELLGYTLMSNADFEVFALLIGSGANGKSVLLDVIRAMVGTANVAAVQPSQLSSTFHRAHLYLKLANLVTEIAEGAEIADAELKAIVSGELITADCKFEPPFDFQAFCTCWFGSNHLPHTRDFSDALFRRAVVIPFNRKFEYGVDADPKLKEKLAAEMPGIINHALAAYGAMQMRGAFTRPPSCEKAKLDWRIEADQVAQFLGDKCTMESGAVVTSRELYSCYNAWAEEMGISRKLGQKNFVTRVKQCGGVLIRGTGGQRKIAGVSINKFDDYIAYD